MDQHQESIQVHVLVSRLLLRVCEFVYEGVGPVSPLALLRRCADQVGGGEVQEAPSGKNGELRHAHGDICGSRISDGELAADQLVNGPKEVTLFTENMEKPTLIGQRSPRFTSRTSSFCSRPGSTSGGTKVSSFSRKCGCSATAAYRSSTPRPSDNGSLWWRFRDSRP